MAKQKPLIHNPPNERADRPNKHTLAIGISGSGKSQVLRQKSPIPERGARVVLFDPSRDHAGTKASPTHYYSNRSEFAAALAEADASGKGFRVGYDGPRTAEIYEWWCMCCHAIMDGNKETYMLTEELGRVSQGAGEAMPYHGWVMSESRKYGGIYVAASQFPARISKDVYDNAGVIWFGQQPPRLIGQLSRDFNIDRDQLQALKKLEFIRWTEQESEKVTIQYKKSH